MDAEEEEFLAAATRIREEVAGPLAAEVARLIAQARGMDDGEACQDVIDEIYRLLTRQPETLKRLNELLRPITPEERSYGPLGGDGYSGYDTYSCPQADYAWPVLDVADPTPPPAECPVHHVPLEFRAAGE